MYYTYQFSKRATSIYELLFQQGVHPSEQETSNEDVLRSLQNMNFTGPVFLVIQHSIPT